MTDFRPYSSRTELQADIRRTLSGMPQRKPGKLDRNGHEMQARTVVEFTGTDTPSAQVSGHVATDKLFNLLRSRRFEGVATCRHVWVSGKGEIETVGEPFTATLPKGL